MKVILLSAGKGLRMMPLTKNTPKCLLHVGNGLTVLETQLEIIKETPKIREIIIVTGYLSEQIEAKVKKYKNKLNIKIVYNPFYDISNNLVSLWFAKHEMDSDFIIINGDNIFKRCVLNKLIEAKRDMCMVIDKKKQYNIDDMKVTIEGDRIKRVSKEIEMDKIDGESVGIMKFQNGANRVIKNILEKMIRDKKNLNVFYLEAINRLIEEGYAMYYVEVDENDWAEIDFHPDYELIKKNIEKFNIKE